MDQDQVSSNFDEAAQGITAEKPQAGKPKKARAQIQAELAYRLVRTLILVYIGIMSLLVVDKFILWRLIEKEVDLEKIQFEDNSKDIITLVLSTSSALVGGAIGFYFNGNSLKDED